MWLDRKSSNLITENEVRCLCSAIEERGELGFSLSIFALASVAGTIFSAQSAKGAFKLNVRQLLFSKLNYSHASVTSFILWLGASNVVIEPSYSHQSGKQILLVKLKADSNIDWEYLKKSRFRSPLIKELN